jgi:fluoroacetyl-CoA thioesterase
MKSSLVPGLRRVERIEVDLPRTIGFLGEEMRIYSTPSMVKDVEYASLRFIQDHLDDGESSVGIHVGIDHLGPTPLGQWVEIHLEIKSVDGRKTTVAAEIRDAIEIVGKAEHVRFVIDVKRHAERLKTKAAKYGTP